MGELGSEELLAEIRAVTPKRGGRITPADHEFSLDVVEVRGIAIGDSIVQVRGSALAEPDEELDPGEGRSFLAYMQEVMDEHDPHAEEPSGQQLNELLYSPPFPPQRTVRSGAAIQTAWIGNEISAALTRFSAKVSERFDSRRAAELGEALERVLDEILVTERAPALEGLQVEPLSETERLTALTDGVTRRFEFERQQLSGALDASEVAKRRHRSAERIELLREKGRLLALENEDGEWRYPRWQFASASSGRLVPGLRGVLEELQSLPPLSRIAWLRQPKQGLDSRSPLEALREGERQQVKVLARSVRGSSW